MNPRLRIALLTSILPFLLLLTGNTWGQAKKVKPFASDAELIALANKYVTTPIKKIVMANGDVFLQRNLSPYLHANLNKANETVGQADYGHDHKDAMLEDFLNLPQPSVATLTKYFNQAAIEFKVPVEILMATGQVQSNWAQVSESMYGSWGVTGIIENKFISQITTAAALLKVTPDKIKNDAQTNIRAAAALLASYQKKQPLANSINDWFASVRELTGLQDEGMKTELAQRIFDVIKNGSKTVSLWGEIIFINPARGIIVPGETKTTTDPQPQSLTTVDYPNAIADYTTCNFGSRPAGSGINFYFVHYIGTGTYQGTISWFKNCTSQVSAHYVVRNSDGQITQMVAEADRAWSQGVTLYNDQGIGTEHEVIATNLSMWDNEPMLIAAGSLCADVCNRRGIPKLRRAVNLDRGIYGHSDVKATDCPNMTQPRWDNFMAHVVAAGPSVGTPVLYSVANSGSGTEMAATWKANTEPTLAGYRLYYATNDALTTWALAANETTLTAATTSVTLNAPQFLVPPAGNVYHFKLTALVTDGANPLVESASSDVYSRSSNVAGPKVLIVDGFDRTGGSYTSISHSFVTSYFKALRDRGLVQASSVANEKVEDGTFVLTNYDMVVWFVGDESSADVVFSANEKTKIQTFLSSGGKLLVSGSEIAYNIGRSGSGAYDLAFMNNYLKSNYVGDGAVSYTPATGIAGTAFAGLNIPFGIVYVEDFPDDVAAAAGSTDIFNYSVAGKKGGVSFKGNFGAGTVPGALIFLSWTLETASDLSMASFMEKALLYFGVPLIPVAPVANPDAVTTQSGSAKRINVLANDVVNGNAFVISTLTIVNNPANGTVSIDAEGNVTYISNGGFTGADNFTYQVQNTSTLVSNITTVTITVVAATGCNPNAPEVDDLYPKRDLRGVWVASVSNIDWPSSRTLTPAQQQAELIKILDTLSATRINAVFLQIRPECDALYASAIDPWSYWLTNAQGTPPSPLWDPLQFAVDQAHARGIELHAWINPYRAKQSTPTLAANHVAILHPDWTFISGTITLLNPGLPDVRTYLTNVIADIASRYDVDGIHFDDYFYPYAGMTGQDNATYMAYNPTAIPTIEDWRRDNVNQLIRLVYDTLQKINTLGNRNVVFGVSPFGIWKSGTPPGISGTSSYSQVYCDPIAWLQAGKIDYVAPQLYWKVTGPQDYLSLSKWWNDQGAMYGRHIYPGLAAYKMVDANNWEAAEIEAQININRANTHNQVLGQIMFSNKQIMLNSKGLKTSLQANQYKYKAFAPAMGWKDAICPNTPANVRMDMDSLKWDIPAAAADGDIPVKYVVYRFASVAEAITNQQDGKKVFAIVAGNKLTIPATEPRNSYMVVTALDKNNNESDASLAVALPLTGFSFDVVLAGSTGILNWSTVTESNTKNFEVERSTDGVRFAYMASIAAAGNSIALRTYSWSDNNLQAGVNYYRIKVVDLDGAIKYSPIKSIIWAKGKNTIIAGPNPFSNVINLSNLLKAERVDILDESGRILYSRNVKNITGLSLPVANFPAGLYHVKISFSDGERKVIKMVKQRL